MRLLTPNCSSFFKSKLELDVEILLPIIQDAEISLLIGTDEINQKRVLMNNATVQLDTGADVSFMAASVLRTKGIDVDKCSSAVPIEYKKETYIFIQLFLSSKELEIENYTFRVAVREFPAERVMLGSPEIQKIADSINFGWKDQTWNLKKKMN